MMKKAGYIFIIVVLSIGITEAGLQLVNFILDLGKQEEVTDKRSLLSPYKGKEWAKTLFKELDDITGEYKDYRGWGKNKYQGTYVNINSEGVRKTWSPEVSDNEKPQTLYIMGPSVVWGVGVRDNHTIPSYISKQLHEKDYRFKVLNYGEWGYSFTQELLYLMLLLKNGERPNYVIFYGWTDIYNAYQSGRAGTLHFSFSIKERMKEHSDVQHIKIGIANLLRKHSVIYKELMKWKNKFNPPLSIFSETAHNFNDNELQELHKDTMRYFSQSYDLLDELSKVYGFKYICFWPPSLFTEEKLTEEETAVDARLQDKTIIKFYKYANDAYKTGSLPHFYNVSDAVRERSKTYYLDSGHLSEEGNETVAKRIISIFEKEYLLKGEKQK